MLVGCAGGDLAEEFGRRLKLKSCTITFVDERDMPRWGQLGCQGFIILNGSGSVVCKTTPAFMDVEALAFRYVESMLDSLVASKPLPTVPPGVLVRIDGLQGNVELNGKLGMCVEAEDANGRCGVSLPNRRVVSVKAANLTPTNAPAVVRESGGCGGCDSGGCNGGACKDDTASTTSTTSTARSKPESKAEPAQPKGKGKGESAESDKVADSPKKVPKKEAFLNGFSLGVCANDKCLCSDCECGASCQCNVASVGIEQEGTCEQCATFRKDKAAQQNGHGVESDKSHGHGVDADTSHGHGVSVVSQNDDTGGCADMGC